MSNIDAVIIMNLKQIIKKGIKMLIDADGSVQTALMRAGKKHLIAALDKILPDETQG